MVCPKLWRLPISVSSLNASASAPVIDSIAFVTACLITASDVSSLAIASKSKASPKLLGNPTALSWVSNSSVRIFISCLKARDAPVLLPKSAGGPPISASESSTLLTLPNKLKNVSPNWTAVISSPPRASTICWAALAVELPVLAWVGLL